MKSPAKERGWKILCFRFIGRSRRMDRWKKIPHTPACIVEKERDLIQEAYDEMRDACLADELYQDSWERNKAEEFDQCERE